jgi:hypothetical protein
MVSRPWQTHIPDAVEALVSLTRGAITAAGATVEVHDGAFIGGGSISNLLIIGFGGFVPGYEYPSRSMSEELGNAAVAGENSFSGLAPGVIETFNIACASMVRSGSTDESDRQASRRTAYANLQYVGQVLPRTPWLNGTVQKEPLMAPSVSYFPVQDRRGLLSVVTFTIRCQAWSQQ